MIQPISPVSQLDSPASATDGDDGDVTSRAGRRPTEAKAGCWWGPRVVPPPPPAPPGGWAEERRLLAVVVVAIRAEPEDGSPMAAESAAEVAFKDEEAVDVTWGPLQSIRCSHRNQFPQGHAPHYTTY